MKVDIKEHVCSTCPWRKQNAYQLQKDVISDMIAGNIISACHQEQAKTEGATETTGVELYAEDMRAQDKPFIVCRGFAIARARARVAGGNPLIAQMNQQILDDGDVDNPDIVGLDYIFGEENETRQTSIT